MVYSPLIWERAASANLGVALILCVSKKRRRLWEDRHKRRKFFKAAQVNKKPGSAGEGIKHISKLYQLEEELRQKNLSNEEFLAERKERAEPFLTKFKAWLDKRVAEVPPSLLLGKALHYTLGQWEKMIVYLESPYLTPDNNACENAIPSFVLGRKN